MATTRKKVSVKSPAKAPAKKTVKKTAAKAATKAAPKRPPLKAEPKKAVKKAVKKTAKKSVAAKSAATLKKKVAKATKAGKTIAPKRELKPSTKAPTKLVKTAVKTATKKKAATKAAPKKAAVKKTAAKSAAKPISRRHEAVEPLNHALTRTSSQPRLGTKTPAKKAVKKVKAVEIPIANVPVPIAAAPAPEVTQAMKGLKGMGGALGARIAQIVAESARQKPASPAPLAEIEDVPSRGEDLAVDISRPIASSSDEPGPVEVAHKAAALLFAKKAEDVVLLDLRNLSTVADYYLICTCHNEPQMRAMLNDVQRQLSREGIKSLRSEYMSGVRWAIIDYGDLIIHLFESQTRGFYSLERLWADAPSTRLKAEDYALAAESDADEDDDL